MKILPVLLALTLFAPACKNPSNAPTPYRDLNKNNRQDVYEDPRQPIAARIDDLLGQMTLEEKAGLLFIDGAVINDDGTIEKRPGGKGPGARKPSPEQYIREKHMNHFNFWSVPEVRALATGYNAIQKVAESSRLGIPVTIASDPRHAATNNYATSAASGDFSAWPEPLGLAALGDSALTRQFADIARQEYRAVGIQVALHPMADLATEPRWPRINGTFGEDAALSGRMTRAYILGFQGDTLGPQSVACMTKHFPGAGPQKEGLDSHFDFHKGQTYPGHNFNYHLLPFEAAFAAGTAQIMPYYGVPTGQTSEDVGMAFNRDIVTKLLREKYRFDGVVCTDWGLLTDADFGVTVWKARAWGVEQLSGEDRVVKILDAGCDMFGGELVPELLVSAVRNGKVTEARVDQSVRRVLRDKFRLGLFDNPYVDVEKAVATVGRADFRAAGEIAQRRALTLLKNDGGLLPLAAGKKLYAPAIDSATAAGFGQLVSRPEDADFAILRLQTPWHVIGAPNFLAMSFHHGDLDFSDSLKTAVQRICTTVPTVVVLYLDRPAVFPEINAAARGVFGDFGATDAAVLDVVFGRAKPEGRLPFELPASMAAVRQQKEDLPHDSEKPVYPFGFGLTY